MRTAVSTLDVRRATSLDAALGILRDDASAGLPRMPIAGATDVYVALNFGTLPQTRFLDIWALDELRTIGAHGDTLVIGALASYTSIIASPLVRERLPMLVEASRLVGGLQIQNRGTLGGNLANASPAGDSLPVLLAVDANVVLRSVDGDRHVRATEFFTGYRATVVRPDELIVAVEIPPVDSAQWFRKVGTRAAQAISKVVVAGVRGASIRFALGSVAAVPLRAIATERALAAGASIDEAAEVLGGEITPIDDVRSTGDYRRRVAMNLLRRFWADTA